MDSNLSRYKRIVKKINSLEKEFAGLSENDLPAKAALLKMSIRAGQTLDKVLPEAFALVREAAKRSVGLRAFDVQLIGAIATHEGKIIEMKTGEGKTLTILFPAFLNSLQEKGIHVVTANDYLAQRDAIWSRKIFQLLGVSVGYITSQSNDFDRQVAYASDVTYVTNNEVGFDYLKDNMTYDPKNKRQRELHFAIIDEADSVLIDEAQTPLIIADNQDDQTKEKELFRKLNDAVKKLKKNIDFMLERKSQTVMPTSMGIGKIEKMIGIANLYGENDEDYLYYVERLLKAHHLFKKDRDYIVENGQVVIVDEFTGRLMENHRFFQGVHQAIEAKEGVLIRQETKTLASITFQNFFKLYEKFSGLTGTAQSSEKEFRLVYKKEVVVVPTNKKIKRTDLPDRFFYSWEDKKKYISWATQEYFFKNGAVLIGTRSISKSQEIQQALIAENIPSNVLNAKHTQREAEIIAQAGQPQTITVATNMAGRGTDIVLDEQVSKTGGLVVFGTERHNAKRIDNQLIGRSGRQGDPGQSQFLISSDDELIKTYFKEKFEKEIVKLEPKEQGIESQKLQKIIEKAQKRMEGLFFDQRILTYEFDKVLGQQREIFYRQRQRVLLDDDLKSETLILVKHQIYRALLRHKNPELKTLVVDEISAAVNDVSQMIDNKWFKVNLTVAAGTYLFSEALDLIYAGVVNYYEDFEKYIGQQALRQIEKIVTLKALDLLWAQHLKKADQLQEAALIASINQSDFFENYEISLSREFHNMLNSAARVISATLFKTINRMWGNLNT